MANGQGVAMGMGDQPQLQKKTPPPSRWGLPRAAVKLLSLFFRHQQEAVQPNPDPLPTPVVASEPEGDEEAKTLPSQPETDATKKNEVVSQPDLHKKTARRRWRVLSSVTKVLLSFFRHRDVSRPKPGPPPAQAEISKKDEADAETKVSPKQATESEESTSGEVIKPQEEEKEKEKEKEHPWWPDLDKRLEKVLEREGIKQIRRYHNNLSPELKNCMLCFSIFKPHKTIKKKTMIYWWIGQKLAKPKKEKEIEITAEDVAEGYFQDLVKRGFIEPIINHCTEAIHDCRIHPFVHWMIKYQAKSSSFCCLDERGNPSPNHGEIQCWCLIKESSNKEQASGSANVENSTPEQKEQAPRSANAKHAPTRNTLVLLNLDKQICNLDTAFLSRFGELEVLQVGRWHSDAKHHIEVEDLESLSSIGRLKKLRYLGLLGLSRLTTLPADIKKLSDLIILDLRDCQNLEKVVGQVTRLRQLTHLDLTECYMLEHITSGIGQLSKLQVFKGFVFGESKRKRRCTLGELSKLKELRKLSINITSEAKIDDGEMGELKKFHTLSSLTITWGQISPFLENESKEKFKQNWTGFELPETLVKFDIRCFPYVNMSDWFAGTTKLTKLYIRGGKLQALAPLAKVGLTNISILRLRYLKDFRLEWNKVKTLLPKLDHLEVIECSDVLKAGLPPLDEYGVWIKDEKDKYEANSSQGNAAIPTGKVASSAPAPAPAPEHAPSDSASTVKVPLTSPTPNVTGVTTTTTPPDTTTVISSAADVTKDSTPTAKPDPSPAAASPGPGPPEDTTSALKSDADPLAQPAAVAPTTEEGKDAAPMPESDHTPAATPAPSSPKVVEDDMLPPKSDASPLASAPAPGPTANDTTHTTESGLSLAAATPATSLVLKADDTAPSTKTSDAAPLNAA